MRPTQSDSGAKISAIVRDCRPSLLLTDHILSMAIDAARVFFSTQDTEDSKRVQAASAAPHYSEEGGSLLGCDPSDFDLFAARLVCTDQFHSAMPAGWDLDIDRLQAPLPPDTLAFLQYTSGSTGQPKGVMICHANLVQNVAQCLQLTCADRNFDTYKHTVGISWLPTFHDMGLIGFHVTPMFLGSSMVYFSPLDFIKEPLMWLRAINTWQHRDHYRYVLTGLFTHSCCSSLTINQFATHRRSTICFGIVCK